MPLETNLFMSAPFLGVTARVLNPVSWDFALSKVCKFFLTQVCALFPSPTHSQNSAYTRPSLAGTCWLHFPTLVEYRSVLSSLTREPSTFLAELH